MNAVNNEQGGLHLGDYVVLFLDLLGQKHLMEGQGFLPQNKQDAVAAFHKTLTSVRKLHEYVDRFLGEELLKGSVRLQRWSDGVMIFVPLGGPTKDVSCEAIFSVFEFAGAMTLSGLAAQAPIRSGIDASWGVELEQGELYGPAVANAYYYESVVAKYPRIAVSNRVAAVLNQRIRDAPDTLQGRAEKGFAEHCRSKLFEDEDSVLALHYVRQIPAEPIGERQIPMLQFVKEFVASQLAEHQQSGNAKLLARYEWLDRYITEYAAEVPGKKR